jgi:hypothetical protein
MQRRAVVALVGLLVVLSGCTALSPTGAPLLTVDNEDGTEYHLTVYVVPGVDDPADLRFRATDADGIGHAIGLTGLRGNDSFRNVTLDLEEAEARGLTIRAGGSTSAAINIWEPGDATVYLIQTRNDEETLVGVHAITCGEPDQNHGITITDGAVSERSATCP